MTEQLKLSERLENIASHIKEGTIFADIGSDHAYLPCFVCLAKPTVRAIAGEVQPGPYQNAKKTVEKYALTDQVDVRLSSGLEVIKKGDQVDTIVIAGMGGQLITDILQAGVDKLSTVETLILQPNTNIEVVRQYLYEIGYQLTKEHVMKENGIIYEILIAKQLGVDPYHEVEDSRDKEFYFGPYLLKEQSVLFKQKWEQELQHLNRIHSQVKQAVQVDNAKLADIERKVRWIKEDVL